MMVGVNGDLRITQETSNGILGTVQLETDPRDQMATTQRNVNKKYTQITR